MHGTVVTKNYPGRLQGVDIAMSAVLFLLAVLLPSLAWSSQLNLRQYDTRDGIPQIQVTSVHQDSSGYLWVGTFGGLARYNGESFTVFRTDSGLTTSYINVVDSDRHGTIWVGTALGLCRSAGERFECFNPDGVDGLMVNDILIAGDSVWAVGDEGLFRFDGQEFGPLAGWAEIAGSPTAHALAMDDDGQLWVGAQAGLFRIADGVPEGVDLPAEGSAVHDLTFESGELWAGADGRLFRREAVSGEVVEIELPLPARARINAIEFDDSGVLWLATPEGVLRGRPGRLERLTTRDGLPNNRILGVTPDREGLIWLATDQGLVKILPGPFEGYSVNSGLLASFVRTINEDDQQRLWLGTREGLQIVPYIDGHWHLDRSEKILLEDGLPDRRVYCVIFEDGAAPGSPPHRA